MPKFTPLPKQEIKEMIATADDLAQRMTEFNHKAEGSHVEDIGPEMHIEVVQVMNRLIANASAMSRHYLGKMYLVQQERTLTDVLTKRKIEQDKAGKKKERQRL